MTIILKVLALIYFFVVSVRDVGCEGEGEVQGEEGAVCDDGGWKKVAMMTWLIRSKLAVLRERVAEVDANNERSVLR